MASPQVGQGCALWIVGLLVLFAVIGQCAKGPPPTTSPNTFVNLQQAEEGLTRRYVTSRSLNCCSGPRATSASIRTLAQGDAVEIRREEDGWSLVDGTKACWSKSSYLSRSQRVEAVREAPKTPPRRSAGSSSAIKKKIIRASIDSYSGACACPYSVTKNGSRCGGRSTWSRGGGYAPLCYARDVTAGDVAAWVDR